jgi:biotin/methionine sulfoxide reductase
VPTDSGLIEISSERIASFGYDEMPGIPIWTDRPERLGSDRSKSYPLMLLANQPSHRLHSQLDMGAFSQESKTANRETLRMHPDDAAARGLVSGEIAEVFNDRGMLLAGVGVSEAVARNVVQLSTGAWFAPTDNGRGEMLCANGNPNVLTEDLGTSRLTQGCAGAHTLVEVRKARTPVPDAGLTSPPIFVDSSTLVSAALPDVS